MGGFYSTSRSFWDQYRFGHREISHVYFYFGTMNKYNLKFLDVFCLYFLKTGFTLTRERKQVGNGLAEVCLHIFIFQKRFWLFQHHMTLPTSTHSVVVLRRIDQKQQPFSLTACWSSCRCSWPQRTQPLNVWTVNNVHLSPWTISAVQKIQKNYLQLHIYAVAGDSFGYIWLPNCVLLIDQTKGRLPVPNLMNFRKTSKGGGGHFRSEKFCCAFSIKKKGGVAAPRKISLQKAQHSFPKIGWGVRGRLEVFRKFIKFGTGRHP